MTAYTAVVTVRLKRGVLDPEAETTRQALERLGFDLDELRAADRFEIDLDAESEAAAGERAAASAQALQAGAPHPRVLVLRGGAHPHVREPGRPRILGPRQRTCSTANVSSGDAIASCAAISRSSRTEASRAVAQTMGVSDSARPTISDIRRRVSEAVK